MADTNERPSKIRKLYIPEKTEAIAEFATPEQTSEPPPQSEKSEETPLNEAEDDQTPIESPAVSLSKNQLKKLRKKEQWAAGKAYRIEKRRDKHKAKQARKAEEREELQQKIAKGEIEAPKPTEKGKGPKRPIQVPLSLIIDCDFNGLMTEKEIYSTSSQITRCYSDNRKACYRVHLGVSSWGGILKTRYETVLANQHLLWKGVRFFEEDFEVAAKAEDAIMRDEKDGGRLAGSLVKAKDAVAAVAPSTLSADASKTIDKVSLTGLSQSIKGEESIKAEEPAEEVSIILSDTAPPPSQAQPEDGSIQSSAPPSTQPSIVYLTSDSPHTLTELSPYTSYIIGGIVDKNRHKGLCYKRAMERGIPTARLPIGEYMTIQGRTVLTINHVVEIMLKWLELGDWGEAFVSVIPKRKEARLRENRSGANEDENVGEHEGDYDDNYDHDVGMEDEEAKPVNVEEDDIV